MILCYLCNNVVFEGDRAELLGMSAHQSCVDDFAFHFPEADLAKMSDAAAAEGVADWQARHETLTEQFLALQNACDAAWEKHHEAEARAEAAFREGAEAMREAAARLLELTMCYDGPCRCDDCDLTRQTANEIRALPLPEVPR